MTTLQVSAGGLQEEYQCEGKLPLFFCSAAPAVLFGNHPLKLRGNITILLPNNFFFSRYKFDAITSDKIRVSPQLPHPCGKFKYKALKKMSTDSVLPSKHPNNNIKRNGNSDVIELEGVEAAERSEEGSGAEVRGDQAQYLRGALRCHPWAVLCPYSP